MPTLSGNLSDFRIVNLASLSPRIIFTPSGPAVTLDSFLMVTDPVLAELASDGSWTAALTDSAQMSPIRYYTVAVERLNPGGDYIRKDFGQWQLYMPSRDCTMRELIGISATSLQAWIGTEPPDDPAFGTGWLNPDTGDYMEWE